MTLTPDAQQRSKWPTEAQIEGLRQFVEWHGAAHTEDCPADDTCGCVCKPLNDAVNSILSESFDRDVVNDDIAALQARLDALHQQLQDVETERDRQTDCALQSQAALQRERDKFDALHQEQEQLRQENQALRKELQPQWVAGIDILMSINAALHAVQANWHVDVVNGQAVAVRVPEMYSSADELTARLTETP